MLTREDAQAIYRAGEETVVRVLLDLSAKVDRLTADFAALKAENTALRAECQTLRERVQTLDWGRPLPRRWSLRERPSAISRTR